MGSVNITIANGNLASASNTADGVEGLVMTGISESGGYTAGSPILVTSMIDVAAAGITVANNPFAIRHLQEFYDMAPAGSQLYVMLVANTMTVASMALSSNANGVKKLLDYAAGAIKVVGLISDDVAIVGGGGSITVTTGLNADVYTAAANLKTTINTYVAAQQPLRGIIGGTSYSGVPANLVNETSGTSNNRVAILIGDTISYDATYSSAAIGLLLGTIAGIPVQRKISRVKTGALSNITAFLKTTALTLTSGDPATIAGKGFITFKMYAQKAGFFWSSDPMCTVTTDDFAMLAHGRIVDKAHRLIYAFLVDEVDNEVPSLPDGTIDPGYAKDLEAKISGKTGVITVNMTDLGNCSGSSSFVDPAQNIVSTSTLNVNVTVDALGYSTTINVNLGL